MYIYIIQVKRVEDRLSRSHLPLFTYDKENKKLSFCTVTTLCPVDGNDRNPCLNGGECIPVQESTPTGHNYVCRCQGDYGGFVCGVGKFPLSNSHSHNLTMQGYLAAIPDTIVSLLGKGLVSQRKILIYVTYEFSLSSHPTGNRSFPGRHEIERLVTHLTN